jgi:long-chain acyl-CoA synthetase
MEKLFGRSYVPNSVSKESQVMSAFECYRRVSDVGLARQPWLVGEDRTSSFGELRQRIELTAGLLGSWNIREGERVVIATRSDREAALMFIALIVNGVTAINLDPDTGPERARSLLSKASPRLVIADREVAARWGVAGSRIELIEIVAEPKKSLFSGLLERAPATEGLHALLAEQTPIAPHSSIDPETLAYIMFTSGTTDRPKGVCISHRALFAHLATLSRRYEYGPASRIMNTLMLAHADGMIQGPVIAFFNAIPVFRPLRFEISSIGRMLDAVYQLRITHLIAVPTMLALIQRLGIDHRDAFQGGDFKLLVSCGAQLEAALCEAFEATFSVPIVNVYGLTETVVGGLFSGPGAPSRMPGSIGTPQDCEARIVDENDCEVAETQAGELWLRGDLVMSGYFEAPAMTAQVLQEGWLRTGDSARRDAAGRYWITGRIKNIIIRGGYNIHPEEITEVLQRHPAVQEAFTLGIEDAVWGETVACIVVADEQLANEDLLSYCSLQLEPRKVPSRIVRVPSLPRGLSGKVLAERARALLQSAATTPARPGKASGADTMNRLLGIAASCFKTDRSALTLASAPRDVPGWDSLSHLELVSAIEKEFSLRLSARDIMSLDRLDKALSFIGRT